MLIYFNIVYAGLTSLSLETQTDYREAVINGICHDFYGDI
jgi:hypothetical protein